MMSFPLARDRKLTIFGRSLVMLVSEVLVNILLWVAAAILWHRAEGHLLNLAVLAWTLGLRHALDADHISAIDNATRSLIGLGQLPVTCGLYFSLGHSTIVVTFIIAIAISVDVAEKVDRVGSVGGVIGAAVSGSFLFIIGLANSVILYKIIRERRENVQATEAQDQNFTTEIQGNTLLMKIFGPVLTFVDKPWKLFVVGLLFGLGFDTASSIALLAVSAIANGRAEHSAEIIILPLLFTAGMTLVDSLDSVLMLYSYAGIEIQTSWAIYEKHRSSLTAPDAEAINYGSVESPTAGTLPEQTAGAPRVVQGKRKVISGLSIILTAMSIAVAFSISIITFMGLIGEKCARCREAAEADDGAGGGLAGSWWRFWAAANEQSQWIGTGIVAAFILVVIGYYALRWQVRRRQRQRPVQLP